MRVHPFPVFVLALSLAACDGSGRPTAGTAGETATEPLPAPAGTAGAVTGMPDTPGPNEIRSPDALEDPSEATTAVDELGNPLPPTDAVTDETADGDPDTAQQAVAVVRDYHAAINSGAPARAYSMWADGGAASGQTAQEFVDGFAEVEGISVEIGTPHRADATVAQVPVTLTVRRLDGSRHRLTGHYLLRRSAEAVASADASAWRIASASLREATP